MQEAKLKVHNSPQPVKTLTRHIRNQWRKTDASAEFRESVKDFMEALPLITALSAPISTLYDIPGLTQPWYSYNGREIPDRSANLALSAVGLAFNAIASAALVYRFSVRGKHGKLAVLFATGCWVIKGVVAVVNLSIFGARTRNQDPFDYNTGFWCAVASAILASLNAVVLVVYAFWMRKAAWQDNRRVQVQGRHFVLSELFLFWIIAIWALIFSRIENWEYFNAIYFCVVTTLTVGFGDFYPTGPATKILNFPFALVCIAALASQVSAIVGFFSARAVRRKVRWRAAYEKRSFTECDNLDPSDELVAEMEFLRQLAMQENAASRLYDLILSLVAFTTFWLLGAVVFSKAEGWTYGNSVYFVYTFALTLGYGNLFPTSNAGRVFFVVYGLIAVPIIASFAIQTVTAVMEAVRESRLEKHQIQYGLLPKLETSATITVQAKSCGRARPPQAEDDEEDGHGDKIDVRPFLSHSELVVQVHKQRGNVPISSKAGRSGAETGPTEAASQASALESADANSTAVQGAAVSKGKGDVKETDLPAPSHQSDSTVTDLDPVDASKPEQSDEYKLLKEILELSLRLEIRARRIMIAKLEPGSQSRLLLQADSNVTQRTVELLCGETVATPGLPSDTLNDLEEIHAYRSTWAELLVAGTRLQRLEGNDQLMHERRRGVPYGPNVQ